MSSLEIAVPSARPARKRFRGPLATLARRRLRLTTRTPRELVVPLLTPIMFALVIAPSLGTALHTGADYEAFVAVGTVGLLIPLNTMFSGLGVIVDRVSGAQRELLTAPIPRGLVVVGNLLVALATTALQIAVLLAASVARGIQFDATWTGIAWFTGAAALFTAGMYGTAEILANRVPRQEEYIARVPARRCGEPERRNTVARRSLLGCSTREKRSLERAKPGALRTPRRPVCENSLTARPALREPLPAEGDPRLGSGSPAHAASRCSARSSG